MYTNYNKQMGNCLAYWNQKYVIELPIFHNYLCSIIKSFDLTNQSFLNSFKFKSSKSSKSLNFIEISKYKQKSKIQIKWRQLSRKFEMNNLDQGNNQLIKQFVYLLQKIIDERTIQGIIINLDSKKLAVSNTQLKSNSEQIRININLYIEDQKNQIQFQKIRLREVLQLVKQSNQILFESIFASEIKNQLVRSKHNCIIQLDGQLLKFYKLQQANVFLLYGHIEHQPQEFKFIEQVKKLLKQIQTYQKNYKIKDQCEQSIIRELESLQYQEGTFRKKSLNFKIVEYLNKTNYLDGLNKVLQNQKFQFISNSQNTVYLIILKNLDLDQITKNELKKKIKEFVQDCKSKKILVVNLSPSSTRNCLDQNQIKQKFTTKIKDHFTEQIIAPQTFSKLYFLHMTEDIVSHKISNFPNNNKIFKDILDKINNQFR